MGHVWANPVVVEQLPFTLDGQWTLCQYFPNDNTTTHCQSSKVPNNIEVTFPHYNGYLVYQKEFTISPELAAGPLAIFIKQLRDSDKFYLNGTLIGTTGNFPPSFEKATLYSRSYYIPSGLIRADRSNEIIIKVYNHARQGGMTHKAPVLDTAENIAKNSMTHNAFLLFYIGMLVIISIVQIFYYLAQPQSQEHVLFSLLCIIEAAYLWTYSDFARNSGISLTTIFRINIFSFCILTVIFCLFIIKFFKQHFNLWFKVVLGLILLSGIASISILHIDNIYTVVNILELVSVFILIPFYLYLFYRAIKEKLAYAKLMAVVLTSYIFTVIIDIAIDLQMLPPFVTGVAGLISPISLILVFIAITLILIHRHWLYYRHATYDYLTKSLRRSAFEERLNDELRRLDRTDNSILVALLDIDHFKTFNDSYSHIEGDQILIALSQRIRKTLRESDLFGRYGGDEFSIAAQVKDRSDAINLLKRLQHNIISVPVTTKSLQTHTISVTISSAFL